MTYTKPSTTKSDKYYLFTDPFKTKDLLWEAYNGFITHYRTYWMYRGLKRTNRVVLSGLISYGVFFFGETDDFLEKVYPSDKKKEHEIVRLRSLFGGETIKLEHSDILFIRKFFGSFMIDSGMKNVIHLQDVRKPTDKLLDERYADIKGDDVNG